MNDISSLYPVGVSPRVADPAVRAALIEAAAHVLAKEGPAALSTRRLAAEVGTSTMRIYTHFGSMSDLHAAVRREGFSRFAATFDTHAIVDDPVASLAAGCGAYLELAMRTPELYWAMFNHRPPAGDDAGEQLFELLQRRVADCIDSGRFADVTPASGASWAGEVWAALHGVTVLGLSDTVPQEATRIQLRDILLRLAIGFGDDPRTARRSIASLP
ncbi:TetR/AcrR family transcriptional regulator [Microlunatus elymi]|uniref:TetR/AcrR family transcriptional regulator n=1 Tax=Microlunatus elymi TaxID=2596828 RepID=UPI00143D1D20|nr:TetR/AcrR family transcriptional regulator [Microlunatus elymi]